MLAPDPRRQPGRVWGSIIRSFAFVRKELVEILRQPRLVALLVLGPFALLLLFGIGYSNNELRLRALFVGPADSIYQEVLETHEEDLGEFVESAGLIQDEAAAREQLRDGDVDVVVVFPDDPVQSVLSGERAVIRVLHDEIDPIQQTAIEVASRLAINEVNATVLSSLAAETQGQVAPAGDIARTVAESARALDESGGSGPEADAARAELDENLSSLTALLSGSLNVLTRLAPDESSTDLENARASAESLQQRLAAGEDLGTIATDADALAADFDTLTTLDPDVLVQPFESDTESVLPGRIEPIDFFTPASLSLLLQHVALTFAALSLVRDRSTGLFELLRISPLSSTEIIVGKCIAYLLVGSACAAALTAAAVYWLGVPFRGDVAWFSGMVVGVIVASLALGLVLSSMARSESQAVQMAMLSLLAGMFFSGFILSIDDLAYPVKFLSWMLPVTYGIRAFQTVMLRGDRPATEDVVGLASLTLAYGLIAVVALRRRLRRS